MINFKGTHYPKSVILYAIFFYVRYAISYRDLEEIMLERGINVDHATLNLWVVKYASIMAVTAKDKRKNTSVSWRIDETYIKIKGSWCYYYRAIDKSSANYAGLMNINTVLFLHDLTCFIDILQVKYLNKIVEQDHRFIKRITKPMMNFKAFHSASATLAGIELAHMIRKKQFKNTDLSDYHQFLELVA